MTSTAHALVAGAIAAHIPNPVAAAGLALISHFIMDSVPHWDFGTNWRTRPKAHTGFLAISETLFGLSLSYILFGHSMLFSHWAITVVAGELPDWLEAPWYIFFAKNNKTVPTKLPGLFEKVSYAFYKVPNIFHTKAQLPLGIITQIVTVGFFLFLLG